MSNSGFLRQMVAASSSSSVRFACRLPAAIGVLAVAAIALPTKSESTRAHSAPSEELMGASVSCYLSGMAFAAALSSNSEEVFYFSSLAHVAKPIVDTLPEHAPISEAEFKIALQASLDAMIAGLRQARSNGISPASMSKMRQEVIQNCEKSAKLRVEEGK